MPENCERFNECITYVNYMKLTYRHVYIHIHYTIYLYNTLTIQGWNYLNLFYSKICKRKFVEIDVL